MRIGIDFDGVLADIGWAKQRYIREQWGVHLEPWQTMRVPAFEVLGEARYLEMVEQAHGTEVMLGMPPLPGALEAVARLGERHELYIVTARLDGEMELARQWLALHQVPIERMVHTRRESKRAAWEQHAIDLHIDDSPMVLRDHPDAMLPVLLHWPYNAEAERCERTQVVADWAAFEALVEQVAATAVR